jgi:hypothetical protein
MIERGFDPFRLLETLNRHGVRYVVIGGFAAKLHGSPALTADVDICYAREDADLERLVAALAEVHPTLRGADEGLPFQLDARTIRNGDSFTFVTDAGDLDILGTPAGTMGYEQLARNAVRMDLESVEVDVASLDDLIAMKRSSGRPRDRAHLEILVALRDELDRQTRRR